MSLTWSIFFFFFYFFFTHLDKNVQNCENNASSFCHLSSYYMHCIPASLPTLISLFLAKISYVPKYFKASNTGCPYISNLLICEEVFLQVFDNIGLIFSNAVVCTSTMTSLQNLFHSSNHAKRWEIVTIQKIFLYPKQELKSSGTIFG